MLYLVSACLAGYPCRYDGKSQPVDFVVELINKGMAHCICPEQLGGLPTPRVGCEIVSQRVITRNGEDVTEAFEKGANATLAIGKAIQAKVAILKSKSPSCGRDKIYDGTFSGKLVDGSGITAELLMANGITVITENEEHLISLDLK